MQILVIQIKINPDYEQLVPRVNNDEYHTIKESIKLHGIREPIVLNKENVVIDGHTRLQIAKELTLKEIPIRIESYATLYEEKKAVIEYNLHRRQLSMAQRCELGIKWAEIETLEAKERQKKTQMNGKNENGEYETKSIKTQKIQESSEVVNLLQPINSSGNALESTVIPIKNQSITVQKTELILQKPEGKAIDLAAEKVGISGSTLQHYKKVVEVAKTNPQIQKELAEVRNGTKSVNKVFKSMDQLQKRTEIKETLRLRALPIDKFEVIYADPPWKYEFSETESRSLENHYPQMDLDDICKLPIQTTDDAILFLWGTSPKLEEALKVMRSWGFTYKTNMVWIKDKIGMGYYARQRHELLLIGTKGKIGVPDPKDRPDSVINAPRTEHSEKPGMYEVIERMYPYRKYIELFARNSRKGWESWGNENGI